MAKGQENSKKGLYGDGTVFRRSDGRLVGEFTGSDGQRRTVYGKTEKICWDKIAKKRAEIEQGLQPVTSWTFERFIEWWLETKGHNLSANTRYRFQHFMKQYGFPEWGKTKLSKLTPERFQNWVNKKRKEGKLKVSSIRQYFSYVHGPLEYAYKMRMIPFNPCEFVELPDKEEEEETAILTPEQAMELVEKASGIWGLVFLFGIGTAARESEILACRWSDIDFDAGEWAVTHNLASLPGEIVEGKPKTKSSMTTIMLPAFLLKKLLEHWECQREQRKARLKAGAEWKNLDLIFCTEEGDFFKSWQFYYFFKATLKKMSLPKELIDRLKPHSLRHSTITWLLDDGQNPRDVQSLARHATLSMTTDRYGKHKMPGSHEKMMMRLDEIVKEQGGDKKTGGFGVKYCQIRCQL